MRQVRFAAVSVLSLVLMLAVASPAFAGISDFAINRDVTLPPGDLQVTVTGTVMCPLGESVFISVTVVQIEHGQLVANTTPSTSFFCSGALDTWTVTGTVGIPMHPGPASASAFAFGFAPPFTFENALTSAELLLQESH